MRRRTVMGGLALLPLAGQAAAVAAKTAGAPPAALRIASTGFAENGRAELGGIAYRVQQEGWLARELKQRGVRLEWLPVTGDTGATMNEAFASGRIDMAAYGDLPSVILNAGGVRTQVIVPAGRGTDQFLLVPT